MKTTNSGVLMPMLMLALVARMASAQSTLSTTYSPGLTVPEGNPAGVTDGEYFSAPQTNDPVLDLTVNLLFAGGYNGDLYVSLYAPDGTFAVLLNQPGVAVNGFGAAGAGMNITLADGGTNLIQNETSATSLTGTYQAADLLAVFQGVPANGKWVLYCANLGIGDGPTTLVSWGVNVTVVPEPSPGELGAMAALVLFVARHRSKRRC